MTFSFKKFPCPTCMPSITTDEDDIIESSCGGITSVEAAISCSSEKITILDGQKQQLDLQFKLEQSDACYQSDELSKTERARKMLQTKINVICHKGNMTAIVMEKTQ